MLQKIKIGTRLALAFAVLLLLISALAAGGISGAKRLTERSAALYGDRTVPLGVLSEISHLTQRNRVLVMDMLMDPGTSNLQASHTELNANVERIRSLWGSYMAKPLAAQEQSLALVFADANAQYLDKGLRPPRRRSFPASTTMARSCTSPRSARKPPRCRRRSSNWWGCRSRWVQRNLALPRR